MMSEPTKQTCFKEDAFTDKNPFVFGLSNLETPEFIIDPEIQVKSMDASSIRVMMWDRIPPLDIASASDGSAAQALLYDKYSLNSTLSVGIIDTQLFDQLSILASSSDFKTEENGLISLLLGNLLPGNDAFTTFKTSVEYRTLVNQGHRVFAFSDSNLTRRDGIDKDTTAINSLIGTTNGHFITIDNGYYGKANSPFAQILNIVYNRLVNSRLLLTGNFRGDGVKNFPTMTLKKDLDNILITATPMMKKKGVTCIDEEMVVVFGNNVNAAILQRIPNTNFYWADNVTVPSGIYGDMSFLGVCFENGGGAPVGIHVRLWTDPFAASLQFANLNNSILNDFSLPNTDQGFTARLAIGLPNPLVDRNPPVDSVIKSEVSIFRCGSLSKMIGSVQTAVALDVPKNCTNAFYYPYFCNADLAPGCPDDFDGIHYAQFTISNADVEMQFTRPFVCLDTKNKPWDNCTTQDRNGNYFCGGGGTEDTYYRGPTGQVIDCSNNGDNYYDAQLVNPTYKCNCNGYSGPSCQNGICSETNVRAGALDTNYRTFTAVFGYGKDSLPINPLKILPSQPIEGVWLYQLFTETAGFGLIPWYIGPDFNKFIAAAKTPLYQESVDSRLILQETLRKVGASFGPSPLRGLTLIHYYVDPSQYTDPGSVVSATTNDSDPAVRESFYRQLQLINQQVLVFTNFDKDDGPSLGNNDVLTEAAFSTGGFSFMVTQDVDDAFKDFATSLNAIFYQGGPAFVAAQLVLLQGNFLPFFADSKSYMIWNAARNRALNLFTGVACTENRQDLPPDAGILKIDNPNQYCVKNSDNSNAYIAVFSKNGYGLAAGFVQKWNDDVKNAAGTITTPIGPSLMVHLNDGYSFSNTDLTTRDSHRTNCTYQTVTYSLKKLDSIGYKTIQLDILDSGKAKVASRVIPFVVTSGIDCKNGGSLIEDSGSCQCSRDWTGIDCSQPICDSGKIGSWGTTCNCLGFGGNCDTPWTTLALPIPE